MKIKVNANYTYETMPDYTDPVEGAKELVVSGHEISVAYIPDVVYDHKSGVDLHLHILQPKIMLEEDRTFPCVIFIKGSAWMKQQLHPEIPQLAKLAQLGYVVAEVEYRHSGIAHHLLNRTLYQGKIKKNCKIKKPMDGALCRIQLHNVPSFIWLYRSYGL